MGREPAKPDAPFGAFTPILSHDTLTTTAPAWTVLAEDTAGGPAIGEARSGKGCLLLAQPSPDRYVIGREMSSKEFSMDTCRQFFENILAYLKERAAEAAH